MELTLLVSVDYSLLVSVVFGRFSSTECGEQQGVTLS